MSKIETCPILKGVRKYNPRPTFIGATVSQYTRAVQKVSSHLPWKIETFTEEDIRYKKLEMASQSPSK